MPKRQAGQLKSAHGGVLTPRSGRGVIAQSRAPPDPAARVEAEDEPPLTLPEVADRLDCSVATVRRRIAAGKLIAVKHGRIERVLPNDLRNFIRASRTWR